jgi:hypothetical protein
MDHWDEKNAVRKKVIQVFAEMRKQGFIARANFRDCNTCAGYAIACDAEKMKEKGKEIKGIMFWHNQAEASFRQDGCLFIGYGNVKIEKFGTLGLPTNEVGNILVEALKKAGVIVEWDGSPDSKILVRTFPEEPKCQKTTTT